MAAPQTPPTTPPAAECSKALCSTSCSACDVFRWKNPITTGCVLGASNAGFFLFAVLGYSALSLLCYSAIFFMGFGFLTSIFLKSSATESRLEVISMKQIENSLLWFYDVVNDVAVYARFVLLWKDTVASVKVVVGLFAAAWVASWLPPFSVLLFFGIWIAFTHTFVLEAYYTYVEPSIRPHLALATTTIATAYSKIPRMNDEAANKID